MQQRNSRPKNTGTMNHNANQHYDERWARAARSRLVDSERAGIVIGFIDSFLNSWRGAPPVHLLDVGCGWGWLSNRISPYGEVTGLEPSGRGVLEARTRFPHITFINDAFPSRQIATMQFEILVCSEVIEHVQEQESFVQGLANAVRQGGALVLTTPNATHWGEYSSKNREDLQPVEQWLTRGRLLQLLCESGFTVMRYRQWHTGFTSRGIYRLCNSHKANRILQLCRCGFVRDRMITAFDLGLYQGLLAVRQQRD